MTLDKEQVNKITTFQDNILSGSKTTYEIIKSFTESSKYEKIFKEMYAIIKNDLSTLKIYMTNGGNVNDYDTYDTLVMQACTFGKNDILKYLYENGADIHIIHNGRTALGNAIRMNKIECTIFLLSKDVDPNTKLYNGETPLMIAAKYGDVQVVKLLLKYGANINARCDLEWSALMLAARHGNYDSCKLLLDKGAMKNIKTKDNYTIKFLAKENGHYNIIDLLDKY